MATINYSSNGKKAVKFRYNEYNGFIAFHIQFSNTGTEIAEDLIQMKTFKTEKARQKWTDKVLAQD